MHKPRSTYDLAASLRVHKQAASGHWTKKLPLTWSAEVDAERYVYLNFSEFWPHTSINRAGPVRVLRANRREDVAASLVTTSLGEVSLSGFVSRGSVDAAIILHRGSVVFESYPRMEPTDKHIWFSVSKTLVSTAIAILQERGEVDATKTIDSYLPKLEHTAWEGIQVLDILDMCSGIDCDYEFDNPKSNFYQVSHAYGFPSREDGLEDPLEFFAQLPSRRPPGEVFEYNDVNPMVLMLLVESVTQERFAKFLEREVWQPMGAESDAQMLSVGFGRAATALGMSSTLRDLARYGLLFTPSGRSGARAVVPESHVHKIQHDGRPNLFDQSEYPNVIQDESLSHNTRQWDNVTTDGDFYKCGSRGQGLYISPAKDVVFAFFGTTGPDEEICGELPRIARQLTKKDLWET